MSPDRTVAVTGAAGHLGSHCIPALISEGFQVLATDVTDASPPGAEFAAADLIDPPSIRDALRGADIVVHCASIHPWKTYTDTQYIDSNIKGTWNLYREASRLGIDRIVLTSSISAIGYPDHPAEICPITEDSLFPIEDLYGLTKNVQESIARRFAETEGVRTIALRPPPFMPKPWLDTGFLLTGVFSVVEDVASAHVAATRALGKKESGGPKFDAFFVVNRLPYTRSDVLSLGPDADVEPLVRNHWPKQFAWLKGRGYGGVRLPGLYSIRKAQRSLGWRPQYNFLEWFREAGGRSASRVTEQ